MQTSVTQHQQPKGSVCSSHSCEATASPFSLCHPSAPAKTKQSKTKPPPFFYRLGELLWTFTNPKVGTVFVSVSSQLNFQSSVHHSPVTCIHPHTFIPDIADNGVSRAAYSSLHHQQDDVIILKENSSLFLDWIDSLQSFQAQDFSCDQCHISVNFSQAHYNHGEKHFATVSSKNILQRFKVQSLRPGLKS